MKRKNWYGSLTPISFGAGIIFISLFIFLNCSKDDKNPIKPPTSVTVTDIDGNSYQTVKIGDQWWMAQNLKVTHYRNGEAIPKITDNTEWLNLITGAYCNYNNSPDSAATWGCLYNWYAVNDTRKIAPAGWHTPTDEEWNELEIFLGISRAEADTAVTRGTDEGGKLKESGTTHWASPNIGATNASGFTALPAGDRYYDGHFDNLRYYAIFWSSTGYDSDYAWDRHLYYDTSEVYRKDFSKRDGFSVRCVRD